MTETLSMGSKPERVGKKIVTRVFMAVSAILFLVFFLPKQIRRRKEKKASYV